MNITHIINLLKAFFIEQKKMLLIAGLVTFGVAAFVFTLDPSSRMILPYSAIFLVVFASKTFQSSLKRNNSVHFFNLPVTAGEKLIQAIFVIIIMGIGVQILSFAGAYIGAYLIHPHINIYSSSLAFNIWANNIFSCEKFLALCVGISVYLFGSIYFTKNSFWKTLGSGIGMLLGFVFYALGLIFIASKVIFGSNWKNFDNATNINIADYAFFQDYYYIFPIAIIVLFLSVTYLRLKETEV